MVVEFLSAAMPLLKITRIVFQYYCLLFTSAIRLSLLIFKSPCLHISTINNPFTRLHPIGNILVTYDKGSNSSIWEIRSFKKKTVFTGTSNTCTSYYAHYS
ncbi:hypothetical protein K7432_017186 [Basidiobolus ranarum]|uniref:Uncharacterized protein n=1 Tax=Basidiobolus ranarum TaxID=34480 RepID=A0ABR2VKY7_9FUNG